MLFFLQGKKLIKSLQHYIISKKNLIMKSKGNESYISKNKKNLYYSIKSKQNSNEIYAKMLNLNKSFGVQCTIEKLYLLT